MLLRVRVCPSRPHGLAPRPRSARACIAAKRRRRAKGASSPLSVDRLALCQDGQADAEQSETFSCAGCGQADDKLSSGDAVACSSTERWPEYCTACWTTWVKTDVASFWSDALKEKSPAPRCVECDGEAQVQGTGKFQGLGYCVSCSVVYFKQKGAVPQVALCDMCQLHPAEFSGKSEFAGLTYCKTCWLEWRSANVLCDECKTEPGMYYGERGFDGLMYCDPCLQKWRRDKPVATGNCIECKERPAEVMGYSEFEGSAYCLQCWNDWRQTVVDDDPVCVEATGSLQHETEAPSRICVECSVRPGQIQGRREFEDGIYCEDCWCQYQASLHPCEVGLGTCVHCRNHPAEIYGSRQFSDCAYCWQCWGEYQENLIFDAMEVEMEEKPQPPAVEDSPQHPAETPAIVSDAGMCAVCGSAPGYIRGSQEFADLLYCRHCWVSWREDLGLDEYYGPRRLPIVEDPEHFDFIEVGTSTWGTLTQYCAGEHSQASGLGHRIRSGLFDLKWARGLAVEVVRNHLNMLPALRRVTKVCAAMDETSGNDTLFEVSPENISRYMGKLYADLPNAEPPGKTVDVMWYAMSLSRIGGPHPELEGMLQRVGRPDLMESRPVPVINWEELCTQHKVGSVDVVQLDCEGKDCAILRGMLAYCEHKPQALPRVIQFEANHLTEDEEIEATLEALKRRGGYHVWSRSENNIIVQRRSVEQSPI